MKHTFTNLCKKNKKLDYKKMNTLFKKLSEMVGYKLKNEKTSVKKPFNIPKPVRLVFSNPGFVWENMSKNEKALQDSINNEYAAKKRISIRKIFFSDGNLLEFLSYNEDGVFLINDCKMSFTKDGIDKMKELVKWIGEVWDVYFETNFVKLQEPDLDKSKEWVINYTKQLIMDFIINSNTKYRKDMTSKNILVNMDYLQAYGITCFNYVLKSISEYLQIGINQAVFICDNTYDKNQIVCIDRLILEICNLTIYPITDKPDKYNLENLI